MKEKQELHKIIEEQKQKIAYLEKRLKDIFSFFSTIDIEISSVEFVKRSQSAKKFSTYLDNFLKSNPKHSKLRVSEELNISNARLFEYLNGTRLITPHILQRVVDLFKLNNEQAKELKFLIEQDRSNKKRIKEHITKKVNDLNFRNKAKPLNPGMSSWMHYA
tara:strand:- start:135 stop:620 length:486 start_codon:yes stop_codon:yes gene_type:complete